jgi:hypothetical protein
VNKNKLPKGKLMEYFASPDDERFQVQRGDLKQTILAQLSQATTMHHIDDVFLWLVHTIVDHFGVQAAQVWAMQTTTMGQFFPQLRSVMCQDLSLSQNIIVNTHVAALAGHMLRTQRDIQLHPVDASFTQYLALLLKRHGLHYCAGAFVGRETLLPPPRMSMSGRKIATPLTAGLLLFFQQLPQPDVLPVVGDIFAQALVIASSRGLLPSDSRFGPTAQPGAESRPQVQPSLPTPYELIACRVEDPMSNPISTSAVLPEEQMRRVYAVINDKRNMAELARLTRLDLRDIFLIVRKLAAIQRIQIYDPAGHRIEDLSMLDEQ